MAHTHFWRRLSHPYLLTPGSEGSAQDAHMMKSAHSAVLQHVLAPLQENMEFCPAEGTALAQHMVASIEVVPAVAPV